MSPSKFDVIETQGSASAGTARATSRMMAIGIAISLFIIYHLLSGLNLKTLLKHIISL
jgi:hypothetical protein